MRKPHKNQLRIIGGIFRGRNISFPDLESLRPTGDRIRETVFNWLAPVIKDAVCLDLFAGSGALGFEAISRGASHVTFYDESPIVIKHLKQNAEILGIKNVEIIQGQAPDCLNKLVNKTFDIIFLDPPFYKRLIEDTISFLETSLLLKVNTLLYIETEANFQLLTSSEKWQLLRSKKSGEVSYHLLQWKG